MSTAQIKETLEKQLTLLSERSAATQDDAVLALYTGAMCELAKTIIQCFPCSE